LLCFAWHGGNRVGLAGLVDALRLPYSEYRIASPRFFADCSYFPGVTSSAAIVLT
jgi:hypothetical protein